MAGEFRLKKDKKRGLKVQIKLNVGFLFDKRVCKLFQLCQSVKSFLGRRRRCWPVSDVCGLSGSSAEIS